MISVIFLIFLVPHSFAQDENAWSSWDEESEINVSIVGISEINLDSSNRLIRAYVDVVNFDPSDGYYLMKVIQPITGKILTEQEILVREKSNGEAGTDIAYMINEDTIKENGTAVLGEYSIEVYSEKNSAIGTVFFSIIQPSVSIMEPISVESNLEELSEDIDSLNGTETSDDIDSLNGTETSDDQTEETSVTDSIQKIPDWVKNIFILYADGSITENELIAALSFLIEQGIIVVN